MCNDLKDCKTCVASCMWIMTEKLSWCANNNEDIPANASAIPSGGGSWCPVSPDPEPKPDSKTRGAYFYAFWILASLNLFALGGGIVIVIKTFRRRTRSPYEEVPLQTL